MFPEAKAWRPDELRIGLVAEFERDITAGDILGFANNSGDHNPLHVDEGYAAGTRFGRRIAHGAFQVGLASALVGMYLPGRSALLGSVSARFPAPLFFPSRVTVRGEITAWNPDVLAGQLRVMVSEKSRQPTAEITVAFTLHDSGHTPVALNQRADADVVGDRPVVMVTGAAGGLGAAIIADLARDHAVLALVNRKRLEEPLVGMPNVREVRADLTSSGWEDDVAPLLGDRTLYGVVQAAWPGLPHGGLLEVDNDVLRQQLDFGTMHAIRLARFLYSHAGPQGGRFVALGSIAGSQKPNLNLAAYSLGKGALEMSVRLLAPELARKQVTANAICPSFVPAGMNRQAGDRQLKLEAARVPLGRLCTLEDITGAVRYLLSPAAGFISGQVLGLTGAQL
jgi:NAD(P)-dependent dehydrogenase (short-subunit alcohol dehydrogenase family)/acyl dehydratase